MYEKLDKLRAEVEKWKTKLEEDKAKLKFAEQKLQEAENSQILADVSAMNLTPEQLAQFLQMVKNGQLNQGTVNSSESKYEDGETQDEYKEDAEDEI